MTVLSVNESALTHDDEARFEAIKAVFAEAVASTDDELMEKYFEGEELTSEEKIKGLRLGVADGSIIPVFALFGHHRHCVRYAS